MVIKLLVKITVGGGPPSPPPPLSPRGGGRAAPAQGGTLRIRAGGAHVQVGRGAGVFLRGMPQVSRARREQGIPGFARRRERGRPTSHLVRLTAAHRDAASRRRGESSSSPSGSSLYPHWGSGLGIGLKLSEPTAHSVDSGNASWRPHTNLSADSLLAGRSPRLSVPVPKCAKPSGTDWLTSSDLEGNRPAD